MMSLVSGCASVGSVDVQPTSTVSSSPVPRRTSIYTESGDGGSGPTTSAYSSEPSKPQIFGLGELARDGNLEFKVDDYVCGVEELSQGGYVQLRAKGQYCIVDVWVRNAGLSPAGFDANNQVLITSDGGRNIHDYGVEAMCMGMEAGYPGSTGTNCANYFSVGNILINPGMTMSGTLFFDLAKEASPDSVELHAFAGSLGVRVSTP